MIPGWMASGDLPPGVYFATWKEVEIKLGFNPWRRQLLAGLRQACKALRRAGCGLVYVDGSFVSRKENPGDFDACWDVRNVDDGKLDPIFWDFSRGRAAQKNLFLGEFFPAQLPEGAPGRCFLEFFQTNKVTGKPKGIVAIRLGGNRRK